MQIKEARHWLSPIFQFHKADTFRNLLPLLVFMFIYSAAVVFLERNILHLSKESSVKNIINMHSLLGFALSMLLVFRTNSAYDRWWEGRKLWGSLVNNSRNLALKINALLPVEDATNRIFYTQSISLYAMALRRHLLKDSTKLALDVEPHPELSEIDRAEHIPNNIARSIFHKTNDLYKKNVISGEQFIILNAELQSFTDICGACERIKNTPIPYSYSTFIKKFIFIYACTLPLGFGVLVGYAAVPIVTFIFYILGSLELIAEEIEDPFGDDANDLPMHKMAENIQISVKEIIIQ